MLGLCWAFADRAQSQAITSNHKQSPAIREQSMRMYATLKGRGPQRDAIIAAGWGLLVTPAAYLRNPMPDRGVPFCIDNGAWSESGAEWDDVAFRTLALRHGCDADFVVCPDFVGDKERSLERTFKWMDFCLSVCHRVLFAVQDGMGVDDVEKHISTRVGVFVGGSTDWKVSTIPMWGQLAQKHGSWCHVGRVNSKRRVDRCSASGVTSCDGTSAVKFPSTLSRITRWMNSPSLQIGA